MKHTPNIGGKRQDSDHQRGTTRDTMLLQAKLRHPIDGSEHIARVRNLSAGGMMVEISNPFDKGDALLIELRGIGEVTGHVAWAEHGRIGIALDSPIDPTLARKPLPQGASTHAITKALKIGATRADNDADAE